MTPLNNFQSFLFLLGGIFMVSGVGAFVFFFYRDVACWLFLAGSLLFTTMQYMQRYKGSSFTLRRLQRIQTLSGILFILSALIMVDTVHQYALPLFERYSSAGYIQYMEILYNKWVLPLLVGAILQVYTGHRIGKELKTKNT